MFISIVSHQFCFQYNCPHQSTLEDCVRDDYICQDDEVRLTFFLTYYFYLLPNVQLLLKLFHIFITVSLISSLYSHQTKSKLSLSILRCRTLNGYYCQSHIFGIVLFYRVGIFTEKSSLLES